MKLTYWYSKCPHDADCYSVRARTKTEAVADIQEMGGGGWRAPVKVTTEYADGFELMLGCSQEGRGYDEFMAWNDAYPID